ncbi:MAG TPA: hypothetical protein VGJ70_14430, partial [Solirubrobacteraceae bacterium]
MFAAVTGAVGLKQPSPAPQATQSTIAPLASRNVTASPPFERPFPRAPSATVTNGWAKPGCSARNPDEVAATTTQRPAASVTVCKASAPAESPTDQATRVSVDAPTFVSSSHSSAASAPASTGSASTSLITIVAEAVGAAARAQVATGAARARGEAVSAAMSKTVQTSMGERICELSFGGIARSEALTLARHQV